MVSKRIEVADIASNSRFLGGCSPNILVKQRVGECLGHDRLGALGSGGIIVYANRGGFRGDSLTSQDDPCRKAA